MGRVYDVAQFRANRQWREIHPKYALNHGDEPIADASIGEKAVDSSGIVGAIVDGGFVTSDPLAIDAFGALRRRIEYVNHAEARRLAGI